MPATSGAALLRKEVRQMTIEARRIEAIETTLTNEEWIALIAAASAFATAVVNAVS